jgi:hypothetical protein
MMSLVHWLLLQHGKYSDRYEIDDVPYYNITDEISRSQFAFDEVVHHRRWLIFAELSSSKFARFLKHTASHAQ